MITTELIPVIHMVNDEQVFANIDTCMGCGVNKVFIINHNVSSDDLFRCLSKVRVSYPSLWLGVNVLGVNIFERVCYSFEGIDAAWFDETLSRDDYFALNKKKLLVFGGLAFKYQPQTLSLEEASIFTKKYTDVATTSGTGTGKPANINKIKDIRKYIDEHPMAIASGVSVDNVSEYKGLANYLLVATSITDHKELIIKSKLQELKNKLEQ